MAAYEYFYVKRAFEFTSSYRRFDDDLISQTGALPCFCHQKAAEGRPIDETYSGTYKRNKTYSEPLCIYQGQFEKVAGWPQILYYGVSLATVAESLVARLAISYLTDFASFKKDTGRVRFMAVSIFWLFFFNYGIMYILAPLDYDIKILRGITGGVFSVLGTEYFNEIGPLIVTNQLSLALMPVVVLFTNWLMTVIVHRYD